jgi:periplasmic protein TonB
MSTTVVIVIAALVLIVSLYDYFTSRSWQQVTSASRNEIVFADRNKEYGAYEIRKNYDRTIIFVILGLVAAIGIAYGAYLFVKSLPEEETEVAYNEFQAEFDMPDEQEEEIIEEEIPEEPPVELEKQLDFREFVITDEVVETRLNTQEDVKDTKAGNQDIKDVEETFKEPEIKQPTIVTPKEPEKIETFVEEEAEFPGGYAEMMKYFGQNMKYPEMAVQAGIEGKANVRFVVEKDGSIGNVTVQKGVPNCPECDKEAVRVIKSMPRWKPGKIGGKSVRSYYSMPVSFKLK